MTNIKRCRDCGKSKPLFAFRFNGPGRTAEACKKCESRRYRPIRSAGHIYVPTKDRS
jgi:hypothetical protein